MWWNRWTNSRKMLPQVHSKLVSVLRPWHTPYFIFFYSFLSLLASYFWHASIIPLFQRLCFYVLLAFLCSFCLSHILLFLVDWVVKKKVFSPCHYPIQRFNRRQSLCSSRSRWPQQGLSQNFHSHSHFVRSASWCHMIIMTHVLRSWFKIHHVRRKVRTNVILLTHASYFKIQRLSRDNAKLWKRCIHKAENAW